MEQMPRWMKWIDQLKFWRKTQNYHAGNSILAAYNLAGYRILRMVPHQIIEWQSVDGT